MPISFDLVRQQWQRKLIIVAAVAIGLGVIMGSRPISSEGNFLHEAVERSGVFLILIGILGRTWCSMYISGRKLVSLVTLGPYSISRNPLYVFSSIAAFGVAAQFGSIVFAAICAAACLAIFRPGGNPRRRRAHPALSGGVSSLSGAGAALPARSMALARR